MSMVSLYFFVMLDSIIKFFAMGVVFLILAAVWFYINGFVSADCVSDEKLATNFIIQGKKRMKISIFFAVLFFMITTFIPSTKKMAFIYIAGKVSQNEKVQQIPEKALDILNLKMNEYLKEMQKEVEGKK